MRSAAVAFPNETGAPSKAAWRVGRGGFGLEKRTSSTANGGDPVAVVHPDSARGETGLRFPVFYPSAPVFSRKPRGAGSFLPALASCYRLIASKRRRC